MSFIYHYLTLFKKNVESTRDLELTLMDKISIGIRVARVPKLWMDWKDSLAGVGFLEGLDGIWKEFWKEFWKEYWKEFLEGIEGKSFRSMPIIIKFIININQYYQFLQLLTYLTLFLK